MIRDSSKILILVIISYSLAKNSGKFPSNFIIGAATSSYQIEGAWNVDGKGENIWDRFVHQNPSVIRNNDTGDVACDSYNRWREDIEIVKALGLQHYRFSISWSRIFPNGFADKVNEIGLNYYKNIVQELVKNNILPVVTLYHWDLPQPLEDVGGLMNASIVEHFVKYSRVVISALPEVKYWVTFNEPKSICLYGYARGILAPGTHQNIYQCAYVLLKCHAETYHMYKDEFPHYTAPMGLVVDAQWSEPKTNSTEDIEAAERRNQFETGLYVHPVYNGNWPQVVIDRVRYNDAQANLSVSRLPTLTQVEIARMNGTSDYLGVNYYLSNLISNALEGAVENLSYENDVRVNVGVDPSWPTGSNNYPVVPFGFTKVLKWIKQGFNDPSIFITECGFSDDGRINDDTRITYTRDYINAILDAMEEGGVNVFGYTHWSLIDNFEWIYGYEPHFGLYSVNFTDPRRPRTPKRSALFLRTLALTRQIPEGNFEDMCSV